MSTNPKTQKSPRLSEQVKPRTLKGLYITERDREILLAVARMRILSSEMIETLIFNSSYFPKLIRGAPRLEKPVKTRCWQRLQLLYYHGYLNREEQPSKLSEGRRPYLYTITEKGLNYLTYHELVLDGEIELETNLNPTYLFLSHLLTINTVRIAIELAVKQNGWKLLEWLDERQLKRDHAKEKVIIQRERGRKMSVAIIPDSIFSIEVEGRDYRFILEIDRATETGQYSTFNGKDFASKIRAYGAYFTAGPSGKSPYETRYGTHLGRVLTITTGPRRAENLKKITEEVVGGKRRYWFSHIKDIDPSTILTGKIWLVATIDVPLSIIEQK